MSTPEKPLCGAVPDLPKPLAWHPCGRPEHPAYSAHVTVQDGVSITWDEFAVKAMKILLGLDR